jgi:DNA-directed RNA polymerase subunit K
MKCVGDGLTWPKNRLTRFEVARLIGARALQISLGAPVLTKVPRGRVTPADLAKLEFSRGIIPITVKRRLPSGKEVIIDIKRAIKKWLREHPEL